MGNLYDMPKVTTKREAIDRLLRLIDLDDPRYDDEHMMVRTGDLRALLHNVDLGG